MKELSGKQRTMFEVWWLKKDGNGFYASELSAWAACVEANGFDSPNAILIDPDKIDWPENCKRSGKAYLLLSLDINQPSWKPKPGESVLFRLKGVAKSGVYTGGRVNFGGKFVVDVPMKPWKDHCENKPWDEV